MQVSRRIAIVHVESLLASHATHDPSGREVKTKLEQSRQGQTGQDQDKAANRGQKEAPKETTSHVWNRLPEQVP